MDRSDGLIVIMEFGDRPQAELARGALESAGIAAMIQSDTVGGMRDHLAWSGAGFKLLVRQDDADTARDLLAPVEPESSDPASESPDPAPESEESGS